MRKLRALSCVLSACIIFGITFGVTSASATYNTLEDLEIDPWGDLEGIQGFEPPTPELAPDDFEPVTMFPDVGLYAIGGYNAYDVVSNVDINMDALRVNGNIVDLGVAAGEIISFPYEQDGSIQIQINKSSLTTFDSVTLSYAPMTLTVSNNTVYQSGDYLLDGRLGITLWVYLSGSGDSQSSEPIVNWPTKVEILSGDSVIYTAAMSGSGNYFFDETNISLSETGPLQYKFYFPQYARTVDLNEWFGNVIFGATLYDNVNVTNSDPELGLLESVVEWLKSIRDGILELPQNIANFILEGLQGLFVPDQEELTELMDKYNALFEERLGFIYQMFTFVVDTFTTWVDTMKSGQDYSFVFPGISVPYNGEMLVVLSETTVSLENEAMDVIRPVLGTVVSMIAVVAFGNNCFDLVIAFMSGLSYIQFITRKSEEGEA